MVVKNVLPHDRWTAEEKQAAVRDALERSMIGVLVDVDMSGVEVPPHLQARDLVLFNLSWKFANTRMTIDEDGVAATLRFNGVYHRCSFPWPSIRAIRQGNQLVTKVRAQPVLKVVK